MVLYRPRTWCAFCPMGTMTQGICQVRGELLPGREARKQSAPAREEAG